MGVLYNFLVSMFVVLLVASISNCGVIDNNETSDNDYFGVQIYPVERYCAMVGGVCVHKDDCEQGQQTSTKGLCRESKHLGVECCYSIIAKPTTCQKLLGECKSKCHKRLIRPEATDCPVHQHCCTLV